MDEKRNTHSIFVEKHEGKELLGVSGVVGRIILKCKQCGLLDIFLEQDRVE
jgi:hypothetical protein